MAFEKGGHSRLWYVKGMVAAKKGKDMYDAWHAATGKPGDSSTSGKRITAQESFYQGFVDQLADSHKNPTSILSTKWQPAMARRLSNGRIQLKISGQRGIGHRSR